MDAKEPQKVQQKDKEQPRAQVASQVLKELGQQQRQEVLEVGLPHPGLHHEAQQGKGQDHEQEGPDCRHGIGELHVGAAAAVLAPGQEPSMQIDKEGRGHERYRQGREQPGDLEDVQEALVLAGGKGQIRAQGRNWHHALLRGLGQFAVVVANGDEQHQGEVVQGGMVDELQNRHHLPARQAGQPGLVAGKGQAKRHQGQGADDEDRHAQKHAAPHGL